MSNQHHTALLQHTVGAELVTGSRTTPTPGPNQVLIHNKAVALNPADCKIRKWGIFLGDNGWPIVLGQDGAGDIVALGSDVAPGSLRVGDRVFYESWGVPDRGTFQELSIADAARVARIPDNLSYEEAATVPLAIATAAIGVYKAKSEKLREKGQARNVGGAGITPPWSETVGGRGKYKGESALIMSGSSSVGQFAIQFAKLSDFGPIITTASKYNEAYCKAAGATHVLDYREVSYEELPGAVASIIGEDTPLTLVYDAVSNQESQKAGWEALGQNGSMVVVNPPSDAVGKPGQDDEKGRHLVWVFGIANDPHHHEFAARMYAALTEMFEKGELKPNKVENIGHGLDVIPAGLDKLEKGVSGVKLLAAL